MPKYFPRLLASTMVVALLVHPQVRAADACDPVVGRIVAVEGLVELLRAGASRWQTADLEDVLCEGDTVRSGTKSRAALVLINEAVLRLDQLTAMRLVEVVPEEEEKSVLEHIKGLFSSFSRQPRTMQINAPYLNGAIEGTEFVAHTEEQRSTITVLEGIVRASNESGSVVVAQGEAATAEAGKAPELRTPVRPRDAVEWALYYPPILIFLGAGSGDGTEELPAHLRSAMQAAAGGDIGAAYAELVGVPEADRDADFYLHRAALGLSVGRVDEARHDIQHALRRDPDAGLAYSLRSIIEVVRNETEAALSSATRGIALSDTAAARIALSYAQQSNFRIEAALDTMKAAVEQHPDDPLAWARLGELWLMLGNSRRSRAAAERATRLSPNLARAQLVLGYAALADFRNAEARSAFERAITLSSADPLAHLGLGLAKISEGNLEQGRQDLEVAVGLDANTSLLRAYLGKAYFEEKRHPLDAEQYHIAKELDPRDPTAYLYHGLLKQTINRPIEAIQDLERSIELNDNRAVYRSRLLLDKDRATRGTSLARAYKDLDFTQLGINEAAKSLMLDDPSNASAHRFLSDAYLGMPRHEVARVSELMQAQLMQDINISPVQPSLAETNLNTVPLGGLSRAGFNEFTSLFERNRTGFNVSGIAGNNDTHGGEAAVSGLHERISYSVGGFTYDTDGWRANNDLEQNLYNVYLQGEVSPGLNLQGELQHRDSDEGDLALQFDPADIVTDKRRKFDRDSLRLGLRYSPQPSSPGSTFLLSFIYSDADEDLRESDQVDPFTTFSLDSDRSTEGGMVEGQYIYQHGNIGMVAGAAYSDPDTVIDEKVQVVDVDAGPVFSEDTRIEERIEHPRAYIYANIHTGEESADWTIGGSYDDFTDEPVEETSFNPKLGVRWQVNRDLALRAAAFQVVKPSFVNNRTIEPTQVAGFNQFFDDLPGTESRRYGTAIDWRGSDKLWGGAQFTWRDLDEPTTVVSETGAETARFDEQKEELHNLYLYLTPTEQLAAKAALVYDRYEGRGPAVEFGPRPEEVRTLSLPLSLTYFDPDGLFATLGTTYVDQRVRRAPNSQFSDGEDNFVVVDVAVGYRLPKRRGVISLAVRNLFDTEFMFQDNSFREFSEEAVTSPFIPDRIIVGQITLSF